MPVNKLLQITKININNQLSQPITEHKRPMLEIHVLPWDSLKSVGLNLIMGPPTGVCYDFLKSLDYSKKTLESSREIKKKTEAILVCILAI